jgi:hypothetical protein
MALPAEFSARTCLYQAYLLQAGRILPSFFQHAEIDAYQ